MWQAHFLSHKTFTHLKFYIPCISVYQLTVMTVIVTPTDSGIIKPYAYYVVFYSYCAWIKLLSDYFYPVKIMCSVYITAMKFVRTVHITLDLNLVSSILFHIFSKFTIFWFCHWCIWMFNPHLKVCLCWHWSLTNKKIHTALPCGSPRH